MNIDKESVKLFDLLSIVFTPSKYVFSCVFMNYILILLYI